MTFLIDFEIEM